MGVRNHDVVERRQVSMSDVVPNIDPKLKVLSKSKVLFARECLGDQSPGVKGLVYTVDQGRDTRFVCNSPLMVALLKDGYG